MRGRRYTWRDYVSKLPCWISTSSRPRADLSGRCSRIAPSTYVAVADGTSSFYRISVYIEALFSTKARNWKGGLVCYSEGNDFQARKAATHWLYSSHLSKHIYRFIIHWLFPKYSPASSSTICSDWTWLDGASRISVTLLRSAYCD